MEKKQVVIINGGDSFDSYEEFFDYLKNREVPKDRFLSRKDWKGQLAEVLGEDFEVFVPRMPNAQNAKYEEWKIWFEKMLPYVHDDVILLGHSQGGIFLAKYLSENKFPCKIGKLFLVAAPYRDTPNIGSFAFGGSLDKVSEQCRDIHLYFSKDDPVVPFSEMEKYSNDLPGAQKHVFEDRGHFIIEDFPEIVAEIRGL